MTPEEVVQAYEQALAAYEQTQDPAQLQRAADAIPMLEPMGALDFDTRSALRRQKLALFARLLDRIDRDSDPAFDPDAYPPPEGQLFQSRLREVGRRAWAGTRTYLSRCFLPSPQSRAELASVIREHVSDADRAARLRELLGGSAEG